MQEIQVQSLSWEDLLEKEMAIHSSTLAWKIPWMEERGRLQSMGSQRVGHDWATSISVIKCRWHMWDLTQVGNEDISKHHVHVAQASMTYIPAPLASLPQLILYCLLSSSLSLAECEREKVASYLDDCAWYADVTLKCMIVLLKLLSVVVLKSRMGGSSVRWAEFCAMHLLFTYMKEEVARDRDLNQFVSSDKHLEETLLENWWRLRSGDLSKWQWMEISVSCKNIPWKTSHPKEIFSRWKNNRLCVFSVDLCTMWLTVVIGVEVYPQDQQT